MKNNLIYPTISTADFNRLVFSRDKIPSLTVFTAEWLGEGTILDSMIEALAHKYAGQLDFYRIDIELSKDVPDGLNIRRFPAVYLFKGGEITDSFTGMLPEKIIEERLRKLL